MGVADNKSYKNTKYFNDNYYLSLNKDEVPSMNVDPDINSTIKKNPYRSNVEIEKDEVVLNPGLSAIFLARGKKHYNGGIPVQLKPDSFIFSNDPSLAFNEKDHDLFEFKKGGNFNKTNNTPSKVLRRNVDLEHYNTLMNNLQDPDKDILAKKSSGRMLEKYFQTLGNLAYAQEAKKGFPEGIPDFAQGTAPVYKTEVKDEVMENKQYAKYGGTVYQGGGNVPWWIGGVQASQTPIMNRRRRGWKNEPIVPVDHAGIPGNTTTAPTAQNINWGLWQGDKLPGFQEHYGISNAADKITNLDEAAKALGYTGPKDNASFQKWLYDSSNANQNIIDKWHIAFDYPNNQKSRNQRNMFDGKIGIRWTNAINDILANRPSPNYRPFSGNPVELQGPPPADMTSTPEDTINPNEVTGNPQGVKRADWQFTPWQRFSQMYNLGKYASAKRYMPYRSRFNPSYVDPALVNPEQVVGDMKGAANAQINSLNSLNPILRNAQASSAYGELLNRVPGVRSQYDNQNIGIMNQFRQYNNQIGNNARMTNMQNDQNYYTQSVVGRQNFDNMRSYLADQYTNNLLQDVQDNQSLSYNLLTQNNPAYGFDWRTGNFTRTNKSILDVPDTTSGQTWEATIQEVQNMRRMGIPESTINALLKSKAFSQMAPYLGQSPTFGQMMGKGKYGGRYNPYK